MRNRPTNRAAGAAARATAAAAAALGLALGAAASLGCFSLKGEPAQPDQAYVLEWREAEGVAPPGEREACLVLRVAEPDAAPGLGTSRMAYSRQPYHVEYFAENRWVDTPAAMLEPLLLRALSRSGLFRLVVPQATPVGGADLLLETELLRLQQVFSGEETSEEQVALAATLVAADGGKVLGRRTFEASEPAPSADPYGGVVAANRALDRLMGELVEWITDELSAAEGLTCAKEAEER